MSDRNSKDAKRRLRVLEETIAELLDILVQEPNLIMKQKILDLKHKIKK